MAFDGVTAKEYENVFSTPEGRKVLLHILTEMGFFRTDLKTDVDIALNNQAKRILQRCGKWPANVSGEKSMDIAVMLEERMCFVDAIFRDVDINAKRGENGNGQ